MASPVQALNQQVEKAQQPVTTTAESDPALKELQNQIVSLQKEPLPEAPKIDMPKQPNAPIINRDEWQQLGMGLVAVAMMAGGARGNWMSAGQFLNGAIQGYDKGSMENAQLQFQRYQEQMKAAKDEYSARNAEYRTLLSSRDKSINEMISQYRIMAAEDNRKDMLEAANTRNLVGMEKALMSHEMMMERIAAQHDKAMDGTQAAGDVAQEGDTLAWMYFVTGKAPPLGNAKSPQRAAYLQGIEHIRKQLGMSGPEFAAMAGSNQAIAHAQNKLAEVDTRIKAAEDASLKNMDLAIDAARKVNLSQLPIVNKAIIAGKKATGDASVQDYQVKLQTALREYAKVSSGNIGASGLTDTQIREMNSTISDAASLDQLIAARNAMALDMGNVQQAYDGQLNGLRALGHSYGQQIQQGGQGMPAVSGPQPGTEQGGYRFKGGDPSQQANWEKL